MFEKEIKFRAWDKDKHRMRYNLESIWCGSSERIGFTYMQYIGLKDKNGREIYEGDVIRLGNGDICVIKHHTGNNRCSMFIAEPINKYPCAIRYEWFTASNCEVIGNIYENPDITRRVI